MRRAARARLPSGSTLVRRPLIATSLVCCRRRAVSTKPSSNTLSRCGLQPDDTEAHGSLATALLHAGRFEEAIGHFREVARLEPNSALALSGLCATLRMVGRLDEARQACEAAVRLQPELALAHVELANTLQQQRQYEEAVEPVPGSPAIGA